MMFDELVKQAQTASPFVATFCLVVMGGVIVILWKQLLFERKEHRQAEAAFTASATLFAVTIEKVTARIKAGSRK